MSTNDALISSQVLELWAADILEAGGFTAQESAITARSLVQANLSGHDSHGIIRVISYTDFLKTGELASEAGLLINKETPSSLWADAQFVLGQIQMPHLLEQLITKAQETGSATGSMRNCGHTGRIGEWTEYIASRKLAGFVFVNDNGIERGVAPPGGKEGVTSTNPVAFGLPLPDNDFFSVDFSTSATAFGKVRLAWLAGTPLPAGQIQDVDGMPSTDPAILYEGSKDGTLLPMGGAQGYKGFALSMIVDMLTAGLSGGFTPPAPEGAKLANNVFAVVLDPEHFGGLEHLQTEALKYIDFIRSSAPVDPASPIRLPGDRLKAERKKRLEHGIPLSMGALAAITKKSKALGVPLPPEVINCTVV